MLKHCLYPLYPFSTLQWSTLHKLGVEIHTRLIESVINDTLRFVTGCLRLTPTDNLPILAGIQPAGLLRLGATLLLANRSILNFKHFLHDHLVSPLDAQQERLKSRCPFAFDVRKLFDNASKLYILVGLWTDFA